MLDDSSVEFTPKWIKNVKEGHRHDDGYGADCGDAIGAICISCGKKMLKIWDTVCVDCGGTSCYEHSEVIDGHWYCMKCAMDKNKLRENKS